MLELILLAQYKTIIKMIKILSSRQMGIVNRFFRQKQLFCDSVGKSGVEVEILKHSKFSNFMGLSTEMKNLSKKQQQNEKQEMRQAEIFTILALIGIASLTLFLYYNEKFTFRLHMIVKRISANSEKTSRQKNQPTLNLLVEMENYLVSHPYQYKTLVDSVFHILSSLPVDQKNEEIQLKIQQIYLRILEHNFKAATSQILKDGLQKLIERNFFSNRRINIKIIEILLSEGSIRQLYLAIKYLQQTDNRNWIFSQGLRQKLIVNYQRNNERNTKYFQLIFSKIEEQRIPLFNQYKKMQQQRLSYLQKFLKKIVL